MACPVNGAGYLRSQSRHEGYPETPTYEWWNWHDSYNSYAVPEKKRAEV